MSNERAWCAFAKKRTRKGAGLRGPIKTQHVPHAAAAAANWLAAADMVMVASRQHWNLCGIRVQSHLQQYYTQAIVLPTNAVPGLGLTAVGLSVVGLSAVDTRAQFSDRAQGSSRLAIRAACMQSITLRTDHAPTHRHLHCSWQSPSQRRRRLCRQQCHCILPGRCRVSSAAAGGQAAAERHMYSATTSQTHWEGVGRALH